MVAQSSPWIRDTVMTRLNIMWWNNFQVLHFNFMFMASQRSQAGTGWQPGDLVNFLLTALGSLSSVLQPTWLWQNNVVSQNASFNCLQKLLKFTIFFAMWYAFLCVSCVLVLVSTHGLLYSTFDFICGSTFILWSHKTSFI